MILFIVRSAWVKITSFILIGSCWIFGESDGTPGINGNLQEFQEDQAWAIFENAGGRSPKWPWSWEEIHLSIAGRKKGLSIPSISHDFTRKKMFVGEMDSAISEAVTLKNTLTWSSSID